ncbi:hypothetical protein MANES_13G005400v8 [Manihot esculenta]|uniref:Uncharacterized protein n=1 Tax=Manihot esculenta TaxID=3983 RepID=A0ACB7GJ42_MANES|nr:hypothetical protein MANES_13G005400v8 [Manihot esculenta]
MMIMAKLSLMRTISLASAFRIFHSPLLMGTIHSPTLLFTCSFHSSSSSRSASKRTHKDASLKSKFYSASFRDLDDALASFNHIILFHPLPSIDKFGRFLSALVRIKQYHTVVSLFRKIELLRISHNVYSLNILINCYCRLHHVDFAFSILGKFLKLGVKPDIVTFNTLIDGLCKEGKINRAVDFFNHVVARGYEPVVNTYNVIVNGLCKFGETNLAIGLLRGMVERL